MEQINVGLTYLNINFKNCPIKEFEIGLDNNFDFNYKFLNMKTKIHHLSFGFLYIHVKGDF